MLHSWSIFLCDKATGNIASDGVADGVGKGASEVVVVGICLNPLWLRNNSYLCVRQ